MKYHIWVIGCQYNEWDGARLNFLMQSLGFTESKINDADVVIILACSVRQTAIDRIYGRIKNWPEKKIILSGCVLDADKSKFTTRGIRLFDSGDFPRLIGLLGIDPLPNNLTIQQFNNSSAFIPIMTGCNNFCAYCAVPYTRGREKSRPMDEIIHDAKELIAKGEKEIILLGQNVNSYDSNRELKNQNQKKKADFTILLEELNALDGDFVISFTSNHPKDMSDDIIEAVASLPKIKKSIHLPLQSGSDTILKAMNRPYDRKQYLAIVEKIKTAGTKYGNPIEITTDVIVGFPGESEEDFQQTVEMFRNVDFAIAFVNKYSPRRGTAAEKLGDPISLEEKISRWNILNDIANK